MRGSITVRRPSHLSHRSAPDERAARASFLCGLSLPGGARLDDEQVAAALAWAETRLLLIQGPPGTGKTVTAAAAVVGEALTLPAGSLVLVSAPTHSVVDRVMKHCGWLLPQRYRADRTARIVARPHPITLLRLHGEVELATDGPIEHIPVSRYVSTLRAA
jgi:hypothetical protein